MSNTFEPTSVANAREELKEARKQIGWSTTALDSFTIEPSDYEEAYAEMIDNTYSVIVGKEIMRKARSSAILLENDKVAYNTDFNMWLDTVDKTQDPAYQELQEELAEHEEVRDLCEDYLTDADMPEDSCDDEDGDVELLALENKLMATFIAKKFNIKEKDVITHINFTKE